MEFTDEEGYGRYLDLHDCYLKYINLKGAEVAQWHIYLPQVCVFLQQARVYKSNQWHLYFPLSVCQKLDYLSYLSSFDQLFDISKDRKNAEYKK